MAFFEARFFSEVLGLSVTANVMLPQATSRQIGMSGTASRVQGEKWPVLYLLHGLSDDHSIWARRTSLERYAAGKPLAIVMPAVGRSFYQDMASGARYWTYVSEELPQLMQSFFPISSRREDSFAAGLSMGGYGAMRLGLAQPDRFAAVASFSGALDVARICREGGRPGSRLAAAEVDATFGPKRDAAGTPADLWTLAEELAKTKAAAPALYLSCGLQDSLLPDTRRLHAHLTQLSLPHEYVEGPGDHEWGFWDAQIQRVLEWLPLSTPAKAVVK